MKIIATFPSLCMEDGVNFIFSYSLLLVDIKIAISYKIMHLYIAFSIVINLFTYTILSVKARTTFFVPNACRSL